ncbi:MAG: hypothetical protein R3C68_04320 [Myxococcota bacterium]
MPARSLGSRRFLPLDRLFTKAGFGTVGTGTTLRGGLHVGDSVEAFGNASTLKDLKIRGLQALSNERSQVVAGMRTAVNLVGRRVDELKRGMVIASAGVFQATPSCVALLDVLEQAEKLAEETLTAHIGTTEREVRVIPLGRQIIGPGK